MANSGERLARRLSTATLLIALLGVAVTPAASAASDVPRVAAVLPMDVSYPIAFAGGVRVAAADFDGDGLAELITGASPGGTPQVRVFDAGGAPIGAGFFAY